MPSISAKLLTSKRTWLQFWLRTLFVLVVVAAIPCVWLKSKLDRKAKELAAVAEIKKLGGCLAYDLRGALWARELFGDDFFSAFTFVWNRTGGITDADIFRLHSFTDLKGLHLCDSGVTDLGFMRISELTGLKQLVLVDTSVSDVGLVEVRRLTQLVHLNLAGSDVTNSGLIHLRSLKKLQNLNLSFIEVSDAGLVEVKGLTSLKILWLSGTTVSDAGVADLQAALPSCRIIR
jgi:hypothetical protein